MRILILILLFFLTKINFTTGQTSLLIEGKILDKLTKEPIPYANIYNKSIQKGTISNIDGYFRLVINDNTDTITITYIGYKSQNIKLKPNKNNYIIYLEEDVFLLREVTITPKDDSYLYQMIIDSKNSISNVDRESKAYYELKSFIDDQQVELVEGYYNIDVNGYHLKNLHMKAGRVGMRPKGNRFFLSLESSKAILMLNLCETNEFFPISPLSLSLKNLKKKFYIDLENKYIDDKSDSIYIIQYQPKDKSGRYFKGNIWINKTKNQIIKITLNCENAGKHPFKPLFKLDKIANVSFYLTQTYKTLNGQAIFNHTDFNYKIDYASRYGSKEQQNYPIFTRAILYAYDYNRTFNLPIFEIKENDMGDYRKVNAIPYNDFFWRLNDEYRLHDSLNSNEVFFHDSITLNNKTLFKSNSVFRKGLFEQPCIRWSHDRIKFRDISSDTIGIKNRVFVNSDKYKLAVKLFVDFNTYQDSTNIITATMIDPFESYYHLPMDERTHCFINMYFDLGEIARQELEQELRDKKCDVHRLNDISHEFLSQFKKYQSQFLDDVARGTNDNEMKKYNKIIIEKLGIDNLALFQVFSNKN